MRILKKKKKKKARRKHFPEKGTHTIWHTISGTSGASGSPSVGLTGVCDHRRTLHFWEARLAICGLSKTRLKRIRLLESKGTFWIT